MLWIETFSHKRYSQTMYVNFICWGISDTIQTVFEKINKKHKETQISNKIITSIFEDYQVDLSSINADNDEDMLLFSTKRNYNNMDLDIFNDDNTIEIESFEEYKYL